MENPTREVLLADNAWLSSQDVASWCGRFLPDRYVPRRVQLVASRRANVVVGPRQAGKSTLIWKTLAEAGRPTLWLNCEEPSIVHWLKSPAVFLADVAALGTTLDSVFFEEIQRLPEAGLFLKGVVDRHPPFVCYATGSSSFDLEAFTRESLAGRATRHLILPLSLGELAPPLGGAGVARDHALEELVARVAVLGAYPAVATAADPRAELAGLVEAVILRDASDRFKVRHVAAFRKLLHLMASQIGNLCNLTEWAALCGVSNDTVADYARLLEEVHVVRLVRPFVGGKRAELTSAPKVFFLDNGVRNQLFGGFAPLDERPDRGALIENLVYGELCKHAAPLLDTLCYWRSKAGAEVDFVLEHEGRLAAVEVKAGAPRGGVSRSSRSFIDAYRPAVLLIVSREQRPDDAVDATRVRYVRLQDLPAAVDEFLA